VSINKKYKKYYRSVIISSTYKNIALFFIVLIDLKYIFLKNIERLYFFIYNQLVNFY